MNLIRIGIEDARKLWQMQTEAFQDLYKKYQDTENSPAAENIDKTIMRLQQPFTYYYFIQEFDENVGAVRVVDKGEKDTAKRISPIFVLPQYQRLGIAQKAIRMVEALHGAGFELRVTDLNPDNIGQVRCGVKIQSAALNAENACWADIVLSTGSVLVNDTYRELNQGKPVLYYGVTAAGLTKMFDLPRICFCGR